MSDTQENSRVTIDPDIAEVGNTELNQDLVSPTSGLIENPPETGVTLTASQERAVRFIKKYLPTSEGDKPRLLILTGPSGIGKTTVLEEMRDWIENKEGLVVNNPTARFSTTKTDENRPIVTTATAGEMDIIGTEYPGYQAYIYEMGGMNQKEAVADFERILSGAETKIPLPELVQLSMGVPSLIRILASEPGLTWEAAIRITARYLKPFVNPESVIAQNFHISPPPEVLTHLAKNIHRYNDIYYALRDVLRRRIEIQKKTGLKEVSPEFVDPITLELYNAALEDEGRRLNSFDILVPDLSPEDLEIIGKSLGLIQNYGLIGDIGEMEEGPRVRMFMAEIRKLAVWLRTPEQKEFFLETEYRDISDLASEKLEQFEQGKLPLKPTKGAGNPAFYLHKHEHRGLYGTVLLVGWMVESLLQQKGIPYIAFNQTAGKKYYYNPEKRKITEFDSPEDKSGQILS